MINIRLGTKEDTDGILKQLRMFSDFYTTNLKPFPDSIEHAEKVIWTLVDQHLLFVAQDDDRGIIGLIAGIVTPHFFNPEIKILAEALWWVDPEFRSTNIGGLLLKEFLKWGEENVDWVTMVLEHNSPIPAEAITRRGFKLQETSYVLEVN